MHKIINQLPGVENLKYLELGVGDGQNFERVKCRAKIGVDNKRPATVQETTDQFFKRLGDLLIGITWDLIYIDADHRLDQVTRDLNNSFKYCAGWIAIHDMIPPSAKYTAPHLCADSYRLLYHLKAWTRTQVLPMGDRYGTTWIKSPADPVILDSISKNLTFKAFKSFIAGVRLYTDLEIIRELSK